MRKWVLHPNTHTHTDFFDIHAQPHFFFFFKSRVKCDFSYKHGRPNKRTVGHIWLQSYALDTAAFQPSCLIVMVGARIASMHESKVDVPLHFQKPQGYTSYSLLWGKHSGGSFQITCDHDEDKWCRKRMDRRMDNRVVWWFHTVTVKFWFVSGLFIFCCAIKTARQLSDVPT